MATSCKTKCNLKEKEDQAIYMSVFVCHVIHMSCMCCMYVMCMCHVCCVGVYIDVYVYVSQIESKIFVSYFNTFIVTIFSFIGCSFIG